ncbi:hypothetical protein DFH09DRAFT_1269264 [Mycena vulgaris]|nr:hypothetical protein DFH09DRAFT_1269264 [Mycena vulgaris]
MYHKINKLGGRRREGSAKAREGWYRRRSATGRVAEREGGEGGETGVRREGAAGKRERGEGGDKCGGVEWRREGGSRVQLEGAAGTGRRGGGGNEAGIETEKPMAGRGEGEEIASQIENRKGKVFDGQEKGWTRTRRCKGQAGRKRRGRGRQRERREAAREGEGKEWGKEGSRAWRMGHGWTRMRRAYRGNHTET